MILWGYHNGLCDPVKNIGICRQFGTARDVDDYLELFIASLEIKFFKNWQMYVTNDNVPFEEMDHHVLFNEPYGLSIDKDKFNRVDIEEVARRVNAVFMLVEKKRSARKAKVEKKYV